jgi:glutamyl-tRNA synthetase
MAAVCQEKIATLNEIVAYTDFFFVAPSEYEAKGVNKQWRKEGARLRMERIIGVCATVADWNAESLKHAYEATVAETGCSLGELVHPTRLTLTGKSVGPGLFELAELLGKDECLARLEKALTYIDALPTE